MSFCSPDHTGRHGDPRCHRLPDHPRRRAAFVRRRRDQSLCEGHNVRDGGHLESVRHHDAQCGRHCSLGGH